MQKNTRFLQERNSGNYRPGDDLVNYYHDTMTNYPRLKGYSHPLTEFVISIIKKITNRTDNLAKLYRQIGVLKQYFQVLLGEVQKWPDIYPIDIGHINKHKGTLDDLRKEVKDLKDEKETGNKRKLTSDFGKVERKFIPLIQEIMTHTQSCEDVSTDKIITHGEPSEELGTELPNRLYEE